METDFSQVGDVEDYSSIPPGTYLCRISDVRESETRDGSARWALRLEVAEGDYAGRTAAWDGLVWSERGVRRVKYVLERLGFDTSGVIEIEPGDLLGRELVAQLLTDEWEDPQTGVRHVRLRVPYLGYGPVERPAGARAG